MKYDTGPLTRALRAHLKMTQAAFAEWVGVSQTTVSRWENDGQETNPENYHKLVAKALEYGESGLINGEIGALLKGGSLRQEVAVVGRVGAGAEVQIVDSDTSSRQIGTVDVPAAFGDVLGVEVVGDSMYPAYRNGDVILFERFEGRISDLIGQECLIATDDGHQYIKTLERGSSAKQFDLHSHNASPIRDVTVTSACPVAYVDRRGHRR